MTQKQTILGRISQLAKANINSILDRAEDPEKMLDQLVRDYTNSIAEAEEAVAQTIANVRMAEADLKSDEDAAQEWGRKAGAASRKAEELRAGGDTAGAEKNVTVEKLKEGLVSMKTKLGELKSKRGTLVARARSVEAQGKVNEAMRSIDVMDPTSDLGRFEDKITREEALVAGRAEAQATSLEDQFDQLDDHGDDAEVEARLAALKNQG